MLVQILRKITVTDSINVRYTQRAINFFPLEDIKHFTHLTQSLRSFKLNVKTVIAAKQVEIFLVFHIFSLKTVVNDTWSIYFYATIFIFKNQISHVILVSYSSIIQSIAINKNFQMVIFAEYISNFTEFNEFILINSLQIQFYMSPIGFCIV